MTIIRYEGIVHKLEFPHCFWVGLSCPYVWSTKQCLTNSSRFQPSTLVNDIENFEMENDHLWKTFTVMIAELSRESFRIIGLEETASSCQSILEPSFNNQVTCEEEKTANWKSFAHLLVCCLHLIIARRKEAANWKSFAHILGMLGPPDRVWFKWFNSYFAGDDDIRLGHDLHHVSHYNHQVIHDYVFYLIGLFSIGPFSIPTALHISIQLDQ